MPQTPPPFLIYKIVQFENLDGEWKRINSGEELLQQHSLEVSRVKPYINQRAKESARENILQSGNEKKNFMKAEKCYSSLGS